MGKDLFVDVNTFIQSLADVWKVYVYDVLRINVNASFWYIIVLFFLRS